MSVKKPDTRQIGHRSSLPRLSKDATSVSLKELLPEIDREVTPLFELSESAIPDLILNVGAGSVQNSDTELTKTFQPINGTSFSYAGGTITFPGSDGGNIVPSTGSNLVLDCPIGEFNIILVEIDSSGDLTLSQSTPDAVEANVVVPSPTNAGLAIGYVTVSNVGGIIQNIENDKIIQFVGGGGSGGLSTDIATAYFTEQGEEQDPTTVASNCVIGTTVLPNLGTVTQLTLGFSYPVGQNPGASQGALEVRINGVSLPRAIGSINSFTGGYLEDNSTTITLDLFLGNYFSSFVEVIYKR